jgi:hypothetical protein
LAHPAHQAIRQRYQFRCGYCGVSEAETGGELTVDHYVPVVAGGDDTPDNLVYACFRCNTFKGDSLPHLGDPRQTRILHPLNDNLTRHLREDVATGLLEALTPEGESHIAILRLNRAALTQHRLARQLETLRQRQREILETENAHLREMVARLTELLEQALRGTDRDPEA